VTLASARSRKGRYSREMGFSSLREQPTGKLQEINSSVEALLLHSEFLPTELRIKLDTLHADLAGILEDRDDLGESGGEVGS
jgi:hypothetical protein